MPGYGCELRFDYLECSDTFWTFAPRFYGVRLGLQLLLCLAAMYALVHETCASYIITVAPHSRPSWAMLLRRQCKRLSSNIVLYLNILVLICTLAASIHHAAFLNHLLLLPPLLVKFLYNAYRIFLITNLFITVCFCYKFVDRTQLILCSNITKEAYAGCFDLFLLTVYSFCGAICIVVLSCSYCFTTYIWGILENGARKPTHGRMAPSFPVACHLLFHLQRHPAAQLPAPRADPADPYRPHHGSQGLTFANFDAQVAPSNPKWANFLGFYFQKIYLESSKKTLCNPYL